MSQDIVNNLFCQNFVPLKGHISLSLKKHNYFTSQDLVPQKGKLACPSKLTPISLSTLSLKKANQLLPQKGQLLCLRTLSLKKGNQLVYQKGQLLLIIPNRDYFVPQDNTLSLKKGNLVCLSKRATFFDYPKKGLICPPGQHFVSQKG